MMPKKTKKKTTKKQQPPQDEIDITYMYIIYLSNLPNPISTFLN